MSSANIPQRETLFGHPTGLFTLFFAEMWERFSYYGMRALLVLYMMKGFLEYGDSQAYTVYGAYTSLVYMTPFFGGIIADRLLGSRRAVILGGLLMAAGHLMMTVQTKYGFYAALALLICGNGFFKPNISTIVGTLYPETSQKRDGGFTIFYMGINLGAAMSPLLCGYIGETYGWHWGFGLATIGMLTGLAVFVAPTLITQLMIGLSALSATIGLFVFHPNNSMAIAVNVFTGISLLVAGIAAVVALAKGGLPAEAGAPRDPKKLHEPVFGIPGAIAVYVGTLLAIPLFVLLVSGFAVVRSSGKPISVIPESVIKPLESSDSAVSKVAAVVLTESSTPAGLILFVSGFLAFGYLGYETFRLERIPRQRMYVIFVLTVFSMLFWAFFEQAGSSLNNFTDRNIDRVIESRTITADEVGQTIRIQPTQEQLGFHNGVNDQYFKNLDKDGDGKLTGDEIQELIKDNLEQIATKKQEFISLEELQAASRLQLGFRKGDEEIFKKADKDGDKKLSDDEIRNLIQGNLDQIDTDKDKSISLEEFQKATIFTMDDLDHLRKTNEKNPAFQIDWNVAQDNVGMGIADRVEELPTSIYQSVNPICILVFGLVFSVLWTKLGSMNAEPSTPFKFSLGLLQLGLAFGCFWYGAIYAANGRGMVSMNWLILGYLVQTTGELCLSPVGLSMVTKLSPRNLVSTVMGMWFLATAFSQLLASIIAQFTKVPEGSIPPPIDTVRIYGDVFGKIAIAAMVSAGICFLLVPLLKWWMHEDKPVSAEITDWQSYNPPGERPQH